MIDETLNAYQQAISSGMNEANAMGYAMATFLNQSEANPYKCVEKEDLHELIDSHARLIGWIGELHDVIRKQHVRILWLGIALVFLSAAQICNFMFKG